MTAIRSYQDLEVWKKGLKLVKSVYDLTQDYPKYEIYGLSSQTQRAAVSIPANIAEGRCRHSRKEYIYHLKVANGSLAELETHLYIAIELGYIKAADTEIVFAACDEVGRMLNGLIKSLTKQLNPLKPETRHLEPIA